MEFELELKIKVKVSKTDTLADVRCKINDQSGVFLLDNIPQENENQVFCTSIIASNKSLEWSNENNSILCPFNDTPPRDSDLIDQETKKSIDQTEIEHTEAEYVEANQPFAFLGENFTWFCRKHDSIIQKRKGEQFVVIFQAVESIRHKFIQAASLGEAFGLVREDQEIDKSRGPLVVGLDHKIEPSLAWFNHNRYKSLSENDHETSFMMYQTKGGDKFVCINDMVIDTGCVIPQVFSHKSIKQTLTNCVYGIDLMRGIGMIESPIIVIDGLALSLMGCDGRAESVPMPLSVNLDTDLLVMLVSQDSAPEIVSLNDNTVHLYGFIGEHLSAIKARDPATLSKLGMYGVVKAPAEFKYAGLIGKALLDHYVYFSNGHGSGGIRFASRNCKVKLFDQHGQQI